MVQEGIWQPPSLRFSHLNTAEHKHTHRLKHPAVPAATLMSSFILLCTNVILCQPPSLPLLFLPLWSPPTFINSSLPPCLFLLLYICFIATCISIPSCLYSSHFHSFCSSLYPAHSHTPHPSSYPASCTDIAHFSTISASLLFSFIVFSSPLSLLGDPLVTSSLLQLPWFQGKGTVITVWIKQSGSVLLYLTHKNKKYKEAQDLQRIYSLLQDPDRVCGFK